MVKQHGLLALVLALVLATGAAAAGAQENPRSRSYWPDQRPFGLAVQHSRPYGDFSDTHKGGWGVYAIADHPLMPLLSLIGDVGWNHFPGDGEGEAGDVWEISGGAKINFGAFYMGGQVGYFTEVDQTSWVPSMGLRWPRIEVAVRVKAIGEDGWTSFRLGYYF